MKALKNISCHFSPWWYSIRLPPPPPSPPWWTDFHEYTRRLLPVLPAVTQPWKGEAKISPSFSSSPRPTPPYPRVYASRLISRWGSSFSACFGNARFRHSKMGKIIYHQWRLDVIRNCLRLFLYYIDLFILFIISWKVSLKNWSFNNNRRVKKRAD